MENENRLVKAIEVEEIFNYEVSVAEKDPLDAFDSAIQNAATVDAAEVVHGRWISPTKINGRSFNVFHCSVCNGVPPGVSEHTKYCSHCGAKMDGDTYDSRASS